MKSIPEWIQVTVLVLTAIDSIIALATLLIKNFLGLDPQSQAILSGVTIAISEAFVGLTALTAGNQSRAIVGISCTIIFGLLFLILFLKNRELTRIDPPLLIVPIAFLLSAFVISASYGVIYFLGLV